MHTLSLITTCKGRLAHLKETLPRFCALGASEVILVDYGCPENSGEWAEANFPQVKVVRVDDDPGFNPSRARNSGAATATGEYLFFVDADIRVAPEAMGEIAALAAPDCFLTIDPADLGDDIRGTFVVPRAAFEAVQGYDEMFIRYDMEDTELYLRLLDYGLTGKTLPSAPFDPIRHSDELRVKFLGQASVRKLKLVATFYQTYLETFRRALKVPQIEREDREQIYQASVQLVDQLTRSSTPETGARISLALPLDVPPGVAGGDMEWRFDLTMTMRPKNPVAFRQAYQNPLAYKK